MQASIKISLRAMENKAKLQSIAKQFDPKEVFQKLQPGYSKLGGEPAVLS